MAVYYYNGSPIATPLTITSNEPIFDADTISLSKKRAGQGTQRWELSFNIITNDNVAEIFMSSISKSSGTGFKSPGSMIMPQIVDNGINTSGGSTITTKVFSSLYADSVVIDTSTLNATTASGIIKKGYFIKFANNSKIYVTTQDCDLSQTDPTLNFYPSLRHSSTAATTVVTGDSVQIAYWRDTTNVRGITFTDGVLSSPGTINIIEAL